MPSGHPEIYTSLMDVTDEGMAFFLQCCEDKSVRDHVFCSEMGKTWRRQHAALFKRAVSRAGLPAEFVFHGLRHTYASDLVRQGVRSMWLHDNSGTPTPGQWRIPTATSPRRSGKK